MDSRPISSNIFLDPKKVGVLTPIWAMRARAIGIGTF
jgi:hypothetical protein